jgi:hypothetical protein
MHRVVMVVEMGEGHVHLVSTSVHNREKDCKRRPCQNRER